jgi:hypothetical protein
MYLFTLFTFAILSIKRWGSSYTLYVKETKLGDRKEYVWHFETLIL